MPATQPPAFVESLFGYRPNGNPNNSDGDNRPSINIARAIMDDLGIPADRVGMADPGGALEDGIQHWLRDELTRLAPGRTWGVYRKRVVADFRQYEHLANLQALIDSDRTKTLRATIGTDYLVRPDVTVGLRVAAGELLHASVSCKWTIRSDRVQNIRHEAVILTRLRRGRQPHIVAVTAEPLASRIAAIARGTGEVDTVYHVALPALVDATTTHGSADQRQVLDELIGHNRLFDLNDLPTVLAD